MIQMAKVVQMGWLSLSLSYWLIDVGIVSASAGLQIRNPHLLTFNM